MTAIVKKIQKQSAVGNMMTSLAVKLYSMSVFDLL